MSCCPRRLWPGGVFIADNPNQTIEYFYVQLQVLTSCSLLPSSSPLMSLLGEQQPESQLEEAKGLLLAVGGEEGLLALIDVANKKTVSNRCTSKKSKAYNVFHKVYQTKLNFPVLAVSPLDVALLAGCEDGSLHRIELENEVIMIWER